MYTGLEDRGSGALTYWLTGVEVMNAVVDNLSRSIFQADV
jgi:hypothetical protein